MTRLAPADLLAHLQSHVFTAPPMASLTPRRIGVEVELIPLDASSGRRVPLDAENGIAVLPFLRRFAARQGWGEARTPKGVPCFAAQLLELCVVDHVPERPRPDVGVHPVVQRREPRDALDPTLRSRSEAA